MSPSIERDQSSIFRFLKAIFLSSYDHLQTLFIIATTLKELYLITRLKLDLSHLRQHKFKHGFQDTLNPLCSCGNDVESTEHFLLRCPKFVNERHTLLSSLGIFNCSLLENTSKVLTQTLLFGNASLSPSDNSQDP